LVLKLTSVTSFTNGDDSKVLIQNTTEQIYKLLQTWENHEFRNLDKHSVGSCWFGGFFRKTDGAYAKDRMGNFMAGVTGQIKLSEELL
jgi:OOP family OmpA-OmpF porin